VAKRHRTGLKTEGHTPLVVSLKQCPTACLGTAPSPPMALYKPRLSPSAAVSYALGESRKSFSPKRSTLKVRTAFNPK